MKWTAILIAIILLTSCKKHSVDKFYNIKGQILESSSNPIPVTNYTLTFYQKASAGLLGGVSGLDARTKTDNDGKFNFQYYPNKNYGFSTGGTNPNTITIEGIDTIKYRGLYPEWHPVPSLVDTNLNILYLYKKIQILVRKVQFNNSLNTGEILEVITPDSSGSSHKTLTGPIPNGTIIIVDTIKDCKLSIFNLSSNEYNLSATLKKPSYQKDFSIILTKGDEVFREILMIY
ncbi:MAG: hypothetical protein JWN76_3230 [Chitinophagaceae bacterium]|nr:hypothetical protein [Chitinophagaceae bacterium]